MFEKFMLCAQQLRAVRRSLMMHVPQIEPDDDIVVHQARVITYLQTRAILAEQEADRLRRKYEPTRNRVTLPSGITVVQPTGIRKVA